MLCFLILKAIFSLLFSFIILLVPETIYLDFFKFSDKLLSLSFSFIAAKSLLIHSVIVWIFLPLTKIIVSSTNNRIEHFFTCKTISLMYKENSSGSKTVP
ncbi:hypothetical protein WA026_011492 [Henosepilachna vigintioctopunctata]|uniref:Uncharacterized protein n=1 Tax=Henosepilachna vigintioctopunctata TaxID=420089 RepID=A0AAW1TRC7_9CUCU